LVAGPNARKRERALSERGSPAFAVEGIAIAITSLIDEPRSVRSEDALDVGALDAFLKAHIAGLEGEPEIAQYPGGASNLTYLARYPKRDLIVRRPPFGKKAKSAHDVLREARILSALKPVYPSVPGVLAACDDTAVLGCEFYVMERLVGIVLRRDLPAALGLSVESTRRLCCNMLDKLIELHNVDYRAAGLEHIGKGEGYVRRQVAGWSDRWQNARTDDVGAFEDVVAWLHAEMPERDVATCVIHNDFRFDNLVLAPDDPLRIVGVLDWEMATLGDPLMDLGGLLAYWVQADDEPGYLALRRQPTHAPGMLTRTEVMQYYVERTGWGADSFDFYKVFGLFRLAVISQQIYWRYAHGQTTNPHFAGYGAAANFLGERCRRLIAHSKR
jgi:aminoglycoside phosphotransferase (APT) family kinase protein